MQKARWIAKVSWLAIGLFCIRNSLAGDARWPQFRGVGGRGVGKGTELPVEFGPSKNVIWKTAVSPGHLSPVVWEDCVFLTGYDGTTLKSVCLDQVTGHIRCSRAAPDCEIESTHATNGPASPTPATDGKRVYVYFGSYGLIAYDFDGNTIWSKEIPVPMTDWGVGTSPVVTGNRVILNCDQDLGSFLLCVNAENGDTLWKADRADFRRGFSTPLVLPDDGQVVVAGSIRLVGYDLKTGEERWTVRGLPYQVSPTPVSDQGIVYIAAWDAGLNAPPFRVSALFFDKNKDRQFSRSEFPTVVRTEFPKFDRDKDGIVSKDEYEGFVNFYAQSRNALLAIRLGGVGDVTRSHVVWKSTRTLPHVPSLLVHQNLVYTVKNGGMVCCYDAKTGQRQSQTRIPGPGNYFASPVACDDKIYFASTRGTVVVVEAGKDLKVLATNQIGEQIIATPAVVDDTIYVRTDKHLYAFASRQR